MSDMSETNLRGTWDHCLRNSDHSFKRLHCSRVGLAMERTRRTYASASSGSERDARMRHAAYAVGARPMPDPQKTKTPVWETTDRSRKSAASTSCSSVGPRRSG